MFEALLSALKAYPKATAAALLLVVGELVWLSPLNVGAILILGALSCAILLYAIFSKEPKHDTPEDRSGPPSN